MSFWEYLKDKSSAILIYILMITLLFLTCWIFSVSKLVSIDILVLTTAIGIVILLHEYFRKVTFYKNMDELMKNLDEKYFSTEIIKRPKFLEGKMLYDYLYKTNKSMIEKINKYKYITEDFKEYIEAWCHEIKTPVATSKMIVTNNRNEVNDSIDDELSKISDYIDQVLYYARSENVEKDYIIKETNLKDVINNVVRHNKKDLILKKIKIEMQDLDIKINSDAKWLQFIINQIVVNSIKYSKEENSYIKFYTKPSKNGVVLSIEDNGIGIMSSELDRVFEKGFTGTNGRKKYNSTGFGLYLSKKLCNKLEHNILIDSKENEGTTVKIIFPIDFKMKEVVK